MNQIILWGSLIPLVLSISLYLFFNKKLRYMASSQALIGVSIGAFIMSVVLGLAFFEMAKHTQLEDTQTINGQIVSKNREHGTYIENYDCNCRVLTRRNSQGNTETYTKCDTCHRTHYTVKWTCQSTIGGWRLDSEDSLSRSIYNIGDPAVYKNIVIGEPASKIVSYRNYLKSTESSLYSPMTVEARAVYKPHIPAYPENIYSIFKLDRVLTNNVNIPNLKEWNNYLAEKLKTLGPAKQANAIIVFTNIANQAYADALRDEWKGGKKNDIIVVIGVSNFPNKPLWVRVLSHSEKDLFRVKLQDELLGLENLSKENVINAIDSITRSDFVRKQMKEMKYLENEFVPSNFVLGSLLALILSMYLAAFILFKKETA